VVYPVSPYIYQINDGLYVAGSRVSLDSVVINYRKGSSPAEIVESFPTLKLWQVFGALAYYLEHELVIGAYIAEGECKFERARERCWADPKMAALRSRLEAARHEMLSKRT
jgi:uncharacterized protein (DUF433 family)